MSGSRRPTRWRRSLPAVGGPWKGQVKRLDRQIEKRLRPATFHYWAIAIADRRIVEASIEGPGTQCDWSNLPCSRFDGPVQAGHVQSNRLELPRPLPPQPREASER